MTDSLENKLAKLREDYKNRLPDKIQEIHKIWQNAVSKADANTLSLFHSAMHKLHGSASTYGHTEIGKIAGHLEILAAAIEENPNQIKENTAYVENLLNQLQALTTSELSSLQTQKPLTKPATKADTIIYLLDDDKSYENSLVSQMLKFGYKINKLNDAEEYIEQFNKQPQGIMIINIHLVNKSLEKLLIENNQQSDENKIPVIFTSMSGEFSLRLKAVRMGGKAFFVRPLQTEDLINQIDHILKPEIASYRILIVDDEIETANYNAALLAQVGMKAFIITKSNEIDYALHEFSPDLVLIDINMPECNGLELATIIRQQNAFESIPIIYLSAEIDPVKQLNAMKLGADDFISKSTSGTAFIVTVKNRIERYKKLNSLLMKDNLTGLYNFSFIRKQLEIEVKESMLLHNPLSIAMIDLDKFKNINDTYGHQASDHVLKSLGLILRKRLRLNDIVGRYSAAKFLIILPNTSLEAAKSIIDELRKHFLTLNYSWNQQIFNASFSAGIASFPEFHNVEELLEAAEESITKSHKTGINRVEVAT